VGMTRGTPLVANVAAVVQLTGQQNLANLEADSELTLTDLLTTASDAIYDQLEQHGIDPTALTNEEVYEEAVTWNFLARLAILGYLPVPESKAPPDSPYDWSDPYFKRSRPKTSSDDPRTATEGLPVVGNFESGWEYSRGRPSSDYIRTWLPGRRRL